MILRADTKHRYYKRTTDVFAIADRAQRRIPVGRFQVMVNFMNIITHAGPIRRRRWFVTCNEIVESRDAVAGILNEEGADGVLCRYILRRVYVPDIMYFRRVRRRACVCA